MGAVKILNFLNEQNIEQYESRVSKVNKFHLNRLLKYYTKLVLPNQFSQTNFLENNLILF